LARTFTNKERNQKPNAGQAEEINDRLDCFKIFHGLNKSFDRSLTRTLNRCSTTKMIDNKAQFLTNSPMVMLLRKHSPLTLLLVVLLTACNSVPVGQPNPYASAPTPNLATIYFYRTHNSLGGATGVDIKDNGIDIGTVQDGTYFVYHTSPGQHTLTATTDTTSSQKLNFQAGATYYVKAGVIPSQNLFHPSLSVEFDLQGQSAIQNLKRLHYHE
jgi:hypothetical protein